MHRLPPVEYGMHYHIFNRGNNREDIFIEDRNYDYFINSLFLHLQHVLDIFAYCLMKNHFHLLVRIKTVEEQQRTFEVTPTTQYFRPTNPTQQLSNFFNGYAKAINKSVGRTGSLFQKRFGRKPVTSTTYLMRAVCYIHCNPQIHGFVNDFREYPHSSYRVVLGGNPSQLSRGEVLGWFGGSKAYEVVHRRYMDERYFNEIDQEPE